MLRRDLIIAVLMTFCLTSTLFMTIPIRSNSSATGEYDPWKDINDDGQIDVYDLIHLANSFGTTGDPTKPVIIEGYDYKIIKYNVTIPAYTGGNINITTAGYKQISIYFSAWTVTIRVLGVCRPTPMPSLGNISVATALLMEGMQGYVDEFILATVYTVGAPPQDLAIDFLPGRRAEVERTYSVKAPILCIAYYNQNSYDVKLRMEAYLTT